MRALLIVLLFGTTAWGALSLIGAPADVLISDVIVDDALYYVKPAQNLWLGKGYSFDGEGRSNGVQPLWAVVTIGVVGMVPDTISALRILTALSAALWFGAAVILYRTFARFDPWAALFLAATWAAIAFSSRIAFEAMENGLHAFLLASLISVAVRQWSDRTVPLRSWAFYLLLGLLLALFTLTRVDSGLFAVFVGAAVLFGFLRANGAPAFSFRPGAALLVALPGLLLVGGCVALNHYYFDSAAPISGRVKLFYSGGWGYLHGSLWASLAAHYRQAFDLATAPFTTNLDRASYRLADVAFPAHRGLQLLYALSGIAIALALVRAWLGRRTLKLLPLHVFAVVVTLFVVIRTTIYAVKLSHFTPYCIWYLAPELMLLSLLLTLAIRAAIAPSQPAERSPLARPAPWSALIFVPAVVALLVVQVGMNLIPPSADLRTNPFLRAAHWFDKSTPAGSRIGAFSSGILGAFAERHQVFNLDGLMNTRDYFENYIKPNGYRQYAVDNRLGYLADYAPAAAWRSFWGFSVESMELVRWWPMSDDLRYCVWRILPLDAKRDVLDPCTGPCDRVSQIQFAAEVDKRFPLVAAAELPRYLEAHAADKPRVICSIVEPGGQNLRHVVPPRAVAESLRFRMADIEIPDRLDITFDGALRLLGVDIGAVAVRGGGLPITTYWQRLSTEGDLEGAAVEIWIHPADPRQLEQTPVDQRVLHHSKGCYGTYPPGEWQINEVVVETVVIPAPPATPAGNYPVTIGVYSPTRGWLKPDHSVTAGSGTAFVGNTRLN